MLPDTCDVDIFEVAFANVGLCSDTVWTKNEPDIYKRVNRELWIKTNRLRKYFKALESRECTSETKTFSTRTVRDTIPFSNLAKYGNYKYDEQRENLYIPDESQTTYECICDNQNESKEPWMCPGVEEEFKRLTNASSTEAKTWSVETGAMHPLPHRLSPATDALERDASWASRLLAHYPQLATALRPGQQDSLFSETELEHLLAPISQADLLNYPPPRYCVLTSEEVDLQVRVTSSAVRSIWDVKTSIEDVEDADETEDVSCPATSTPQKTILQDLGESRAAEGSESTAAFSRSLAMTVAVAAASSSDTVPVYKRMIATDGAPLRTPPASSAAAAATTPAPCFVATAAAAAAASAAAASGSSRSSRSASPEIAHFDRLIRIILDEEPYRSVDVRASRQPVLLAADEIDWFISVYPDRYNEMLSINNLANDILDLEQQMEDVKRYLAFPPTAWIQTTPSENELGTDSLTESLLTSTPAITFSSAPDETPERESAYEPIAEHTSETAPISLSTFVSAPELPDTPTDTPSETPGATPDRTPASTPEPPTVLMAERESEASARSEAAATSTSDSVPLNRLEARPRRRLYRDVLASAARNPPRQLPPPPPPPSQLPTPVPLLSIMVQKPVLETQPSSVSVSSGGTLAKSVARASRGQKVSPTRRSSTQRATSTHKAPPRRAASAQKTSRGPLCQRMPIVQISHMTPSSIMPHDSLARDTSPGSRTANSHSASGAPSPAASPPATSTPLISPRANEILCQPATETPPVACPAPTSPRSPRGETPPLPQSASEPIAPNAKTQTFAEVAAGPAKSRGPSPLSSPTRQGKRPSDPLDRRGASVLSETSLQRRLEQLLKQAAEQLKPSESHALRYKEHERPAAGALVAAAVAAAEQFSSSGRGGGRGEVETRTRVSALPPGGVRPLSPLPPRGVAAAASKRAQSQHTLALAAAAGVAAAGPAPGGSKSKPAAASRSLCSLAAASPTRVAVTSQPVPTSPRAGALLTVEHGGGDRNTPVAPAVVPRRRLVLVCGSEKNTPPVTPLLPTDTSDSDEGGGGDECASGVGAGGLCSGRRRGPRIELASTVVRHSRRLVAAVLEGSGSGGGGTGGGGSGASGPEGGDGAAVATERRRDAGDDGSSAPAVSAAKEAAQKDAAESAGAAGVGAAAQPPGGAGDSAPVPVDSGAAAEAQALEHHPNAQRTQVSAEPGMQSADSLNDPYGVTETWVHPPLHRGILRIGEPFCDGGDAGGMLGRFCGGDVLSGNPMPSSLLDCEHSRSQCDGRTEIESPGKRPPRTPTPFPRDIILDPASTDFEMINPLNGSAEEKRCQEVPSKFWKIATQMGCGDQLDPAVKLLDIRKNSIPTTITEDVHENEVPQLESLECSGNQIRCKRNSAKVAQEKVYGNSKWAENLRICKSCQRRLLALENVSDEVIIGSEYGSEDYEDCFAKTLRLSRSRLRKGIHCIDDHTSYGQQESFQAMNIFEWDQKKKKVERSFEKKMRARALDLQWKDVLFTGHEVNFIREISIRVSKHKHVSMAKKLENLRRLEFLWQQESRDSSRWLVPALAVKAELLFPLYCSENKLNEKISQENSLNVSANPQTISKPEEPVISSNTVILASNTIAVNILVESLENRHMPLPRTVLSDLPPLSMISKLSVCTKLRHFVDRAGRKNADRWLVLDILANRGLELRQERRRPFRACVILQSQALVLARNYRARMRCAVNAAVLLHVRPFAIFRINNGTASISKKKLPIKVKDVATMVKNSAVLERTRNTNAGKHNESPVLTKTNKVQNKNRQEPTVQQTNMKRSTKRISCNSDHPLTQQKAINEAVHVGPKKVFNNVAKSRKHTPLKKKDTGDIDQSSEEVLKKCVATNSDSENLKMQEQSNNTEYSNASTSNKLRTVATDPCNARTNDSQCITSEKVLPTINPSRNIIDNKVSKIEDGCIVGKRLIKDVFCKSDIYGKAAGDDANINISHLVWKSLFPKSPFATSENVSKVSKSIVKECKKSDLHEVVKSNNIFTNEKSNVVECVSGAHLGVDVAVETKISEKKNSEPEKTRELNLVGTSHRATTSVEIDASPFPSSIKQNLPQSQHVSTDLPQPEDNTLSGQEIRTNMSSKNANTLDSSQEVFDKATSSETTSPPLSLATTSDLSDDGSSRGTSSFEFDDSMSFDGDPLKKFCTFTRLFRRKKAFSTPRSIERGRKRKTIENIDEVRLPKESCGDGLDIRKKKKKDSSCILQ